MFRRGSKARGILRRLEYTGGILYDGAHNAAGAAVLKRYIEENIEAPLTMIFGAMNGKALSEISRLLFPLAENLILTTPENPRAMPAEEIAEFAQEVIPTERLHVIPDIEEALKLGRELAAGGLLMVTGSFT